MSQQNGSVTDNRVTHTFTKYKNVVTFLRERFLKAYAKNEFINIGKLLASQNVTSNLTQALKAARAVNIASSGRAGSLVEWIYTNEHGNDEVDNKLIQKILDVQSDISKASALRQKHGEKIITSSIKRKKKFDLDGISIQIEWLNKQIANDDLAHGFLRNGERDMYEKILKNFEFMLKLTGIVKPALRLMQDLSDALNG